MKQFFILLFLMLSVTNIICQNNDKSQVVFTDSVVVSAIDAIFIYPLTNDRKVEELHKLGVHCNFIYPLLILNDVIIREEEKVNCFRNHFDRTEITKTKLISAEQAEKKGIPNVPQDGVLFVTTKKGYYFDFSCE